MSDSKKHLPLFSGAGIRIGMLIIASGLGLNAFAYVILALQAASHIPNSAVWAQLYETAWAVGWLLAAIGTVGVALSFKINTDNCQCEEDT